MFRSKVISQCSTHPLEAFRQASPSKRLCFFSVAAEITFVFNCVWFPYPPPPPSSSPHSPPLPYMSSSTYHPPFPSRIPSVPNTTSMWFVHGVRLHSTNGLWHRHSIGKTQFVMVACCCSCIVVLHFPPEQCCCSPTKLLLMQHFCATFSSPAVLLLLLQPRYLVGNSTRLMIERLRVLIGGRFFFLQSQLCVLTLIQCSVHPRVAAVAHKRPRSFCQKCRCQVTPKHIHPWPNNVGVGWLPLSRNELTHNLSGNIQPQSSQLAEPLWTDSCQKSGINAHELISTSKKKKGGDAGREWVVKLYPQILASEWKATTTVVQHFSLRESALM